MRFERATSCVTPCVFYTSDQESLTNKLKKAQYSKDKNKINTKKKKKSQLLHIKWERIKKEKVEKIVMPGQWQMNGFYGVLDLFVILVILFCLLKIDVYSPKRTVAKERTQQLLLKFQAQER